MRFPWFRRKADPFTRNRPVLRSPVMERLDALFADPVANASIYSALLADPATPLSAEYLRSIFATHGPDPAPCGATAEDVITHLFDHILGPASWWGSNAQGWRGPELLTAGYRDAIARAQARGNVPIRTFQQQPSADGRLQVLVLDAHEVVVVLIATPRLPTAGGPVAYKLEARQATSFRPVDNNMPEVSAYTSETLGG